MERVANRARTRKGSLYRCLSGRTELVGEPPRHRYLVR